MKLAIAAMLAASTSVPALADQPGRGWLTQPALSRAVSRQGYRVLKVEADDGHWEGEMSKAGRRYEFHADPRTGHLTKIELKCADHH